MSSYCIVCALETNLKKKSNVFIYMALKRKEYGKLPFAIIGKSVWNISY